MSLPNSPRSLALSFPLHGSRLIEASAGTGKTYTIAALYVRLVLGHGPDNTGFTRALLPAEILVVTFTDAATQELRDRIRRRLVEASHAFRGELSAPLDDFLTGLLADYPAQRHPALARQLELAAQSMDDAAIATIHAWCQRMLREHAFDSGSLFTEVMEPDLSELLADAVRDYWRAEAYPLPPQNLPWIETSWQSPDAMLPTLSQLLKYSESSHEPLASLQNCLVATLAHWQALKAPWLARADHIEQCLLPLLETGDLKGQFRHLPGWLNTLRHWAGSATSTALKLDAGFKNLNAEQITKAWKAKTAIADDLLNDPIWAELAALPEQIEQLPEPSVAAWHHAARSVAERFAAAKQRRALLGFDDLLTRLDAALQGERGETLRELIRAQFPVALIDEFQDTDPLQYRLFNALYTLAANDAGRGIFLIGDPKQAIYSFRGADIHAYLQARADVGDRLDALDTNYRSSQRLVDAVNGLFTLAEVRSAGLSATDFSGAFGYADAMQNPMPFVPVKARGLKTEWWVDDTVPAPLTVWTYESEQPINKETYRAEMAARCASEMVRLLNLGEQGKAGFRHENAALTAVAPADMAVLVRDFTEATAIRQALAARGLRSVYLSDRDSIFDSPEAADVLRLLSACAAPESEALIRNALACASLAQPLAALDALQRDDAERERACLRFAGYRQLWRERGVLPLLRRILFDYALPTHWQQIVEGERRLTNWLHLSDMLQQASRELDGEQALIRWLRQHIEAGPKGDGEHTLRLESDEGLVKVITIHKSKGLEYPLVFLPFVANFKNAVSAKRKVVFWHDGERRRAELNASEAMKMQAEAQRLREDMRLLYVALTRAQHACWLGLAHLGKGEQSFLQESAIGVLLWGATPLADAATWVNQLPQIPEAQIISAPEISAELYLAAQPDVHLLRVATLPARQQTPWWIASYSAIRYQPQAHRYDDAAPQSAREQQLSDDDVPLPVTAAQLTSDLAEVGFNSDLGDASIQQFPRGARWGDFLHGIFEFAAEQGFATMVQQPQVLFAEIDQRCASAGVPEQSTCVRQWILRCLTHPLPLPDGGEVALADAEEWKAELEFLLPAHGVDIAALDALAQANTLPGYAKAAAQAGLLNGLFKGFIDLVFAHDGRYFVLDYKSNALASSAGAYTEVAIAEAMAEHRYDLQYLCYVLALHRQLRVRLPGYDYDRDIGGVVYFFLRGLDGPAHGVFSHKPSRQVIEAMDQLFQGGSR